MHHKRLYVGDLAPTITQQQLTNLFTQIDAVESVAIITNSSTPIFAFVEMTSSEAAQRAIAEYNGYELAGSRLIVYAVPPPNPYKKGSS